MIKNLPERFPVSALQSFDFGDAEARDDQLLGLCPVPTGSISEFLNNKKDIVVGFRGAGKSAIVRLLLEQKLAFKEEDDFRSLLVCLDEEFDYRAIRERLLKAVDSERERLLSCRIVWELLLIYRSLQTVRSHLADGDSTIREHLREIDILLGVSEQKPKLLEILLSHKKKIGVKLDANLPHIFDIYAGVEPSLDVKQEPYEANVLKLVEYKRYLNRILQEHKINLYVLFDRLDDFVFLEDYETQKKLLQGLLSTQLDYRQKYPRIKVKAFLRTDLFKKLDLNEFGPDKIHARCVELHWSPSELKHFLAKRVAHNLLRALKLNQLEITVDSDKFLVSRDELPMLTESKDLLNNFNPWRWAHWRRIFWLAYVKARGDVNIADGRMQNSVDVLNEEIITSIFPRSVIHKRNDGVITEIDLFNFIDTHLQFAQGQGTPRLLLLFVNQCMHFVKNYYGQNKDIKDVKRNAKYEYPLLVKKAIYEAYENVKDEAWEVQYQWAKNWESYVSTLERISSRPTFMFSEFVAESEAAEDEAKRFLAFVCHTGLLRCMNDRDKYERRKYEFPLLFRKASAATKSKK